MPQPQAQTREALEDEFVASGERDRIKEVVMHRLNNDGWVDAVKAMAHKEIREQGIKETTAEGLYDKLKGPARMSVSQEVKQELYHLVKDWTMKQCGLKSDGQSKE